MSNVTSLNLSSLGLGTTFDPAAIITGLVGVEQQPLTAMQTQVTQIQSASQSISSFSANLYSLQSAANALSDPTQYASFTATSTDPSIVASAPTSATPGTYSVQVTQLAQAQVTYGNTQTSSTAALNMSGTLGITVGGKNFNIAIGSGDSLATIATNIASSGAPVSASVVFDGTSYRLQVQGLSTGAANAVTFSESGFSLGLSTPANTYQAAQDAKLTVNKIQVSSSTNQVSGAIPGVTLAITNTMASPGTVTVASDPSAISQKVASFVSAYNAAVQAGHAAAGYGTTKASNSLLTGDRGIESSLNRLSSLVTGNVTGADSNYPNLASAGITLNSDGTLALNQATLTTALQSDPSGVERLFVTDSGTGATGVMGVISSTINSLSNNAGAPLKSEIQAYATRVQSLTTQEASLQNRITQYQKQLEAEFTSMEQTVEADKQLFSDVGGTGTFL
jgi:flagellar hook-associated protein 2